MKNNEKCKLFICSFRVFNGIGDSLGKYEVKKEEKRKETEEKATILNKIFMRFSRRLGSFALCWFEWLYLGEWWIYFNRITASDGHGQTEIDNWRTKEKNKN